MQHTFNVSAKLKTPYSEQTILLILKNGNNIGFIYYDTLSESPTGLQIIPEKLIDTVLKHKYPFIETRFEDAYFQLSFYQEPDQNISISFWRAGGHSWKQEFTEGYEIVDFDLARYVRLMAKLVKGFEVIKFEAKVEDE